MSTLCGGCPIAQPVVPAKANAANGLANATTDQLAREVGRLPIFVVLDICLVFSVFRIVIAHAVIVRLVAVVI